MPTIEATTDTLLTIAWLDADNVISAGWSLAGCDPFKLAKNEWGFLLDIYRSRDRSSPHPHLALRLKAA
jgi:hypothetical protein